MPTENDLSLFARTNFRNSQTRFGIKQLDRMFHTYIIGQTGTGKTTLIKNLVEQDVRAGRGCVLLDPHGDLAETLQASCVNQGLDVTYIDIADPSQPYGYNPLRRLAPDLRPLAAAGLLEVFKKMWPEAWGVRMEHILRNALLTLLDQKEVTLADILPLLADKRTRATMLKQVQSERVRAFWRTEFEKYSYRLRAEAIVPIQNKVGALLAHPVVERVLTNPEKNLSLRRAMDKGRVLICNLAKGRLGEDASHLLGGLLVTSIGLAAFSRATQVEGERRAFFLYADEFQNFTTLSLVNMASELRKYRVGMVLAHQYLHQLDPDIQHAVLGNCGTIISFRLGARDATYLARMFEPKFGQNDLTNLRNYDIYLRLMIDGAPSKPFSATTMPNIF